MSRVIAAMACGFTLAACSMSLPSLDVFKSGPAMETLQIESEPPGADARTSQGQTCRTPCELTVASGTDMTVTVAMTGFQPQTLPVHPETIEGGTFGSSTTKLQPNPVYVELQAATPAKPAKKPPVRKRTTAAAKLPPADTSSNQASAPPSSSYPASSFPASTQGYPWPAGPQ